MDFIANHFFELLAVGSSLVVSFITFGVFKQRFIELEGKVTRMDAMGTTFNRENGIKVAAQMATLEHRTNTVEAKLDTMTNILHEIRTDVKLVEAWIQNQPKQNHARH